MMKVTLPDLPLEGGCQCGQLRYRLKGKPLTFYLCHCTECQRQTSSAFGESLRANAADMEFSGRKAVTRRMAQSGAAREGTFCPECGVRVWHGSDGSPFGNIKAGTLDDTSWLWPAGHIWTRSKQPFMAIAEDELDFPRQPEDLYAALIARWDEMTR